MDNISNTENIEKGPLLKEKRPRPPQSEKQIEAFKKAREKLAERHKEKKEAKILDAKRTLLEKEGYVKPPEQTESIQFKIDESDESSDDKQPIKQIPKEKAQKQPKSKTPLIKEEKKEIPKPPPKTPKPKVKQYVGKDEDDESDDEDDDNDSDSSEEIVIIKRTKKNKKTQPKIRRAKSYNEEEDEEEYYPKAPTNFNNYFV